MGRDRSVTFCILYHFWMFSKKIVVISPKIKIGFGPPPPSLPPPPLPYRWYHILYIETSRGNGARRGGGTQKCDFIAIWTFAKPGITNIANNRTNNWDIFAIRTFVKGCSTIGLTNIAINWTKNWDNFAIWTFARKQSDIIQRCIKAPKICRATSEVKFFQHCLDSFQILRLRWRWIRTNVRRSICYLARRRSRSNLHIWEIGARSWWDF